MMKKFAEAEIAFDISKPHPPVKNPMKHFPAMSTILSTSSIRIRATYSYRFS